MKIPVCDVNKRIKYFLYRIQIAKFLDYKINCNAYTFFYHLRNVNPLRSTFCTIKFLYLGLFFINQLILITKEVRWIAKDSLIKLLCSL